MESGEFVADTSTNHRLYEYSELCQIASRFGMEDIDVLYHVTDFDTFNLIRSEGTLCHHVANPTGIWLCATLFMGRLPDRSPYGTHRLQFGVDKIVAKLPYLYFIGTHNFNTDVQYVRLLLSENSTETDGISMNINTNPLLRRVQDCNGVWHVQVCKSFFSTETPKIYVEVMVKHHLVLSPNHQLEDPNDPNAMWDVVAETRRNSFAEISGILEDLITFASDH